MTLTKAVEAAREAMQHVRDYGTEYNHVIPKILVEDALAALPDNPLTEDAVIEIIATKGDYTPCELDRREAKYIFDKLKAANVLYVGED